MEAPASGFFITEVAADVGADPTPCFEFNDCNAFQLDVRSFWIQRRASFCVCELGFECDMRSMILAFTLKPSILSITLKRNK